MHELTFTVSALDEERTVNGQIVSTDPVVLEESHENRPDWRVEDDRTVTLLSANSDDIEVTGFGESPVISGYCLAHDINVDRIGGHNRCPRCAMEDDVRAREREMIQRRADPNMHPTIDAPRR